MKNDSMWTSILRKIDVDAMSVCRIKHIIYNNIILENCVCLAIKIKCYHKFMFMSKLFETC